MAHVHTTAVQTVEAVAQHAADAQTALLKDAVQPVCQDCLAAAALLGQLESILWIVRWAVLGRDQTSEAPSEMLPEARPA